MTPNKQLKTTTVWRGDWTIGQLDNWTKLKFDWNRRY